MKIDKKLIEYIVHEQSQYKEHAARVATHKVSEHRVIAKLLYYRKSVWDAPEEKSKFLLEGDISKALTDGNKLKTADEAQDTVIPFVVILDGGDTGYGAGDVVMVNQSRVTGNPFNPEFLAMADMIKKGRKSKDGTIMLEGVKTPKERIEALEKNWGGLRVNMPWFVWDETTVKEDYMYYELPTPELKSTLDMEKLKALLDA